MPKPDGELAISVISLTELHYGVLVAKTGQLPPVVWLEAALHGGRSVRYCRRQRALIPDARRRSGLLSVSGSASLRLNGEGRRVTQSDQGLWAWRAGAAALRALWPVGSHQLGRADRVDLSFAGLMRAQRPRPAQAQLRDEVSHPRLGRLQDQRCLTWR